MKTTVNQAFANDNGNWFAYEYERPSITADIVCIAGVLRPKVLLIKRARGPYKGCFAFPGGFMNINETLEDCAKRELKEETNIIAPNLQFITIKDTVDRDERSRVLSAVYVAKFNYEYDNLHHATPGDDAASLEWLLLDDVRDMELAFDHNEILEDVINALHL